MCKLLFFSCVGRPPVKIAFRNPNLSILHKYLQYIRLRFILFLRVLRLHAGIDLRGQVDRASSKVNNISELVQRLLRRKRRRTVVVGSRESPPPKSIVIVLIERSGQNKDLRGSSSGIRARFIRSKDYIGFSFYSRIERIGLRWVL